MRGSVSGGFVFIMAFMLLFVSGLSHAADPSAASMEQMQRQLEALARRVEALSATVEDQGRLIAEQKAELAVRRGEVTAALSRATGNSQLQAEPPQAGISGNASAHSPGAVFAAVSPAAGEATTISSSAAHDAKMSPTPGPKIESADGRTSAQLFGRVNLDYTHFDDDIKDHASNANLRRARLGVKGKLAEDFAYKAEIDFGREDVNFKDVYLSYTGLDAADLYLGHFKPPMGLERNTSSNYIQFMESAAVTSAFTRDEIIGAEGLAGGDNWSFAAGIFNEDAGNDGAVGDEAASAEARGSWDVLPGEGVLHVGLGASYRVPNGGTDSETLAAKVTGIGDNLVSTGALANVEDSLVYGAELAGVFGPLSVQGEYMRFDITRETGGDPSFDGWYAQAGYFLTGETRPYKGKTGNFERVKPLRRFDPAAGNWGAVELVGRYDTLDLNDAGITGGELSSWTGGVNWHLTDYIRFMGNVVVADTDGNAVVPDDDPNVFNLRAQWDF